MEKIKKQKLDLEKLLKESRVQDCQETLMALRLNINVFFSWGGHAFTNIRNKILRFKVEGRHHKGHIYVVVNGRDLYDVYLTTTRGTLVDEIKDVFCDELQSRIDEKVEFIEEYEF